jgi:indolepyruvate decarboxylase
MVNIPGNPSWKSVEIHERSDRKSLRAALLEAQEMISTARQPVILADVEVHRFGLQDDVLRFARKTNIPVAATVLGKSVIGEQHPFYLGIYEGAMGRDDVRQYVESSDCLIMLGAFMTDINLGVYTARLDPGRSISATSEKLSIRYHTYEDVRFKDFLCGLLRLPLRRRRLGKIPRPVPPGTEPSRDGPGALSLALNKGNGSRKASRSTPKLRRFIAHSRPLSVRRLFERLNSYISADTVVVVDVGDALFGAIDLFIRQRTEFIGPAYYASMGFAIPAAIGAQMGNPKLRPLVLVGDGAFQMTGLELATVARYQLNPVIVLLNNRGYGTERHMQDGPYNDVWPLHYSRFPDVIGAGRGFIVDTEQELDRALHQAASWQESFCILDVHLPALDRSPALDRLAARLAKNI